MNSKTKFIETNNFLSTNRRNPLSILKSNTSEIFVPYQITFLVRHVSKQISEGLDKLWKFTGANFL